MQIANHKLQIANWRREFAVVRGRVTRRANSTRYSSLSTQYLVRDNPQSTIRNPQSPSAFTLIELLIAILIITILAGLILGIAAVAAENAREAQTRHTVARLHNLLMEHYESYKTRRVKVRQQVIDSINSRYPATQQAQRGHAMAEARLYALRELILMEVPDRWSDILLSEVPPSNAANATAFYPRYLDVSGSSNGRTALASAYLRRYYQFAQNAQSTAQVEALTDNQGAECLYLIVTLACGDGEGRSLFAEKSIGDTDGDSALEFLDGWGNPINFLRWAPGFDSPIQINANTYGSGVSPPVAGPPGSQPIGNAQWISDASRDHDSFDLFRMDPAAFRLVPLIFSGGRDETFGVRLVKPLVTWRGIPNQGASFGSWDSRQRLLPHSRVPDPDGGNVYLGTIYEGATDNVHNHLLGQR